MNNRIVRERVYRLNNHGGMMNDQGGQGVRRDLGALLGITPVEDLDAATKAYVDARGSGGPPVDTWQPYGTSAQGFGWYSATPLGVSVIARAPSARTFGRIHPVHIGARSFTIDALGIVVDTSQASTLMRLGVYSCSDQTLAPIALLADAGTVDCSSTGVKIATLATPLVIPVNTVFIGLAEKLEGDALGTLKLESYPLLSTFPIMGKSEVDAIESPAWLSTSSTGDGAFAAVSTYTSTVIYGTAVWLRRAA